MPRLPSRLHALASTVWISLVVVTGVDIRPALGGCNVIPPAVTTFRGSLGSTNRPFAGPGDVVTVSSSPACDGQTGVLPATTADIVTSIIFTPVDGGPRNVVALAENCAAVDTAACAARSDVERADCIQVNAMGGPVDMERLDARALRFRFPDTDAAFLSANDDLTFTGPATIAVSAVGEPLPCDLAAAPCAQQTGLRICIDALFADDGSCGLHLGETFGHFTALPPPNDYQALCTDPVPPCTGLTDEVRFTFDAAGNLLLPIDWRGVLVNRDAVPVARLLRASSTVEAFEGRKAPIVIPSLDVLRSYSPEGIRLPPLFDPQQDPTDTAAATFFGTTDASQTVLRIARHDGPVNQCAGGANDGLPCATGARCPSGACALPLCSGGGNDGSSCTADADCAGGRCGPDLFDFSSRQLDGVGPVLVRLGACVGGSNALAACSDDMSCPGGVCGAFTLKALDPVPLDGLNQSETLNAFVMEEAIPNPPQDFNGDGDTVDHVIQLDDRMTGARLAIGAGGAEGRAVTRVREEPFSFPALALGDDVVAFLEPEASQGDCTVLANCDQNADGDAFDTMLKVFRLDGSALTPSPVRAVDAAPLINHRSVAVSDGLVFARTAEAAMGRRTTEQVSQAVGGGDPDDRSMFPSISADGRYIAFTSCASNLIGDDTNGFADVFVYDRQSGTTERVSVATDGTESNGTSEWPSISADGRFVAFQSSATNLVANDTNGFSDIFVYDRATGRTERVNIATDGAEADDECLEPAISGDGRYVAFYGYYISTLVPDPPMTSLSVFVRDRATGRTERIDTAPPGYRLENAFAPEISSNGRFVAFDSWITPNDGTPEVRRGVTPVLVHDRFTATTEFATLNAAGELVEGDLLGLSADGRWVVIISGWSNLVAGDTNGSFDVFVRDREAGAMELVSVATTGEQGNNNSGRLFARSSLSADGRHVTFESAATNLVPGDTNGVRDLFVRDRLTGTTERVSVGADDQEDTVPSRWPLISADGRTITYVREVSFPSGNGSIVARGLDPSDPLAIDAALFNDGALDDTVLEVVDTSAQPPLVSTLCPAEEVAVANGNAAFLRPESAQGTGACPGGSLNPADGDVEDRVVQLWTGSGPVQNLGRAATAVAMSADWIAALVSESGENDTDLNNSGMAQERVVQVHPVGAGGWTNVGQAADALDVSESTVAFTTPEVAQNQDLNLDGDLSDRVLQVYDAATDDLSSVGQAAEEFVLGPAGLLALRTSERSQGGQILNADADDADSVLQVYDAQARLLLNSGQAVTPCGLEACDPRVPYRVLKDTVRFLTLEADQGQDLNGDGDLDDLVVQMLNVRRACSTGSTACDTLAAAPAGICTDTARACAGDTACPAGKCFVPPGGCLLDLGTACDPNGLPDSVANPCVTATQEFCRPLLDQPGQGTCHRVERQCASTADCTAPAICNDSAQRFNRLMDPLHAPQGGGAVFTGTGRCIEPLATTCSTSPECEPGEFCEVGHCHRDQGVCAADADCPTGATCRQELVRATAADSDRDEIPDAIDNCPNGANVLQEDSNGNGIGDACEPPRYLLGKDLFLRDNVTHPESRALRIRSRGASMIPLPGSADDPRTASGKLEIVNPSTMARMTILLPAQNWQGLGNPPGSKGYRYADPRQSSGPCRMVLLTERGRFKAVCAGAGVTYRLDAPAQGGLGVRISTGTTQQCLYFGGEILKDTRAVGDISGVFSAVNAAPPASCPLP